MSNADELAFPCGDDTKYMSLTKREHAAILLRVPKSGDDEIDAMIREANRRDAAAIAIQGFMANKARPTNFLPEDDASYCVAIADALIAELERTA